MLPPEKDDEPDKKGQGDGTSAEPGATERPRPAASKRRRKTPSKPEEPATAAATTKADPTPPEDATPVEPGDAAEAERTVATSASGTAETHAPAVKDAEYAERTEAPKQSEPVLGADRASAPPTPSESRPRSGGSFWSTLFGGVIGALIGGGVVWYMLQQQPRVPDPEITAALEQQGGEVETQSQRIASIEGDISALNDALSAGDLSGALESLRTDTEGRFGGLTETLTTIGERMDAVATQVGDVADRLAAVGARLDESDQRIADLEARPIADPETANQVLRSEVADMREEVGQATEEARAQVETMRNELSAAAEATQAKIEAAEQRAAQLEAEAQQKAAEAEAEAQARASAAEAKAALAQVEAAIDSGEPYAEPLATLRENSATEVPDALAAPADSGVPTIGELRESFPAAARAALSASRVATTEGDPGSRVVAFFRTQTRARSLTPQEGDSPDAILSRAEASLDQGNVSASLAELESLPADGIAAMQDWIDGAQIRVQAIEAAQSLSQDMN